MSEGGVNASSLLRCLEIVAMQVSSRRTRSVKLSSAPASLRFFRTKMVDRCPHEVDPIEATSFNTYLQVCNDETHHRGKLLVDLQLATIAYLFPRNCYSRFAFLVMVVHYFWPRN